ncbi:MAG: FAD-binding protein [Nitrospinota bacterium]|nr:FAD-binding protein [Nitrospinota bacterium]
MIPNDARKLLERLYPSGAWTCQPEDLVAYGFDAAAAAPEHAPEAVGFPTTVDQVSASMRLANEYRFPVTPRGAGTGAVGASVPIHGGMALILTRMNRILEIDTNNLTALVEPGLVTGKFQEEVEKLGLFYPPDPASLHVSTLGGNVAMGSGGPRAVKYGVTRDYVLGMEVVLPDGSVINTGAKTIKSVVGYDLTRLMVGSEGTLGIATKIRLRLIPKPVALRTAVASFAQVSDAARAVAAIIGARIIPSVLELMDRGSVRAVEKLLKTGLPDASLLLIETDGSERQATEEMAMIETILRERGAEGVRTASTLEDRALLWKARRSMSQATSMLAPDKINEDVAVPRSRIPDLVARLEELSERSGVTILSFGHAGDGNMHVNILTDKSDPQRYTIAQEVVEEVFRITLELGGTLSGEHGIGLAKAKYIESEIGERGVEITRAIKKLFDPNNILNPGKIIPE